MDELQIRGNKATKAFLERRGYINVETDDENEMVICEDVDNETLVFAKVLVRDEASKGFPEESTVTNQRNKIEQYAIDYLKEHAVDDMTVRFDVVSILVLNNDRAFLRHHVNVFAVS